MSPDVPRPDGPLATLRAWLRTPQDRFDAPTGAEMSGERMAELTEAAIADGRTRLARQQRATRRRRGIVVVAAAAVLCSGGAVAAAILRSQPDSPQTGTACHAEAVIGADAIVVEPGGDPITRCRKLWDGGDFREHGVHEPPDQLAACIGPGGGIDVFPGDESTCPDLGLRIADTELNEESQAIVDLQERLITEINEPDCLTETEASAAARQILDDLGFKDWPVKVNPDATDASCAKAGIGSDNHHVFIFKI